MSEDEFIEFRRLFTNYQAVTNGEGVTIPEELDRLAYQRMKETFKENPGLDIPDLQKIFKIFGTL